MKKILVTGGTVFVSKYVAEYFVKKGYEVYVLNRNTRPQSVGVKLIEADRNHLLRRLLWAKINSGAGMEPIKLLQKKYLQKEFQTRI